MIKNALIALLMSYCLSAVSQYTPDSLMAFATRLSQKGKVRHAILLELKALELLHNDPVKKSNCLNNLGLDYFLLGKYDSSLFYYQKALAIDNLLKDYKRIINRYQNIGITYKKMGRYSLALNAYEKAFSLCQSHGDALREAILSNEIGNLLIRQKYAHLALPYFKKASKTFSELRDTLNYTKSLNNIGNAFSIEHKYDSSLYYYQLAYKLKHTSSSKRYLASTLNNIGQVYLDLLVSGTFDNVLDSIIALDSAEFYLYKSYIIKLGTDNPQSLAISPNNLAKLYLLQSDLLKAEYYLNFSAQYLHRTTSRNQLAKYYMLRSQFYDSLKQPSQAYEYFKQWSILKDSLYQRERMQIITQMHEYEMKNNEKEKVILQTQNKNQAYHINIQQVILVGVLLIVLMLIIFLMIYIKKNKTISKQKAEIERQNTTIEAMLIDNEHRIKNHLHTISTMLSYHARRSDGQVAQNLKDAQSRIDSIVTIHRNLRKQEKYEKVHIVEYLTQLVTGNEHISSLGDKTLKKDISSETESLPIEAATHLGIITNELLTNSFKHAFKDIDEPSITIKLIERLEVFMLSYRDNGKSESSIDTLKPSVGMEIIELFSKNLEGTTKILYDEGFYFQIVFTLT